MENEIQTNFEFNFNRTIKNYPTTDKNIGATNILTKEEKEKFVQEFLKQIAKKLEKERILVIDRFEGNIAVCEDRETEEMINVEISKLPENIQEGDILRYINNKYEIDEEERAKVEDRINDKLKNLFND